MTIPDSYKDKGYAERHELISVSSAVNGKDYKIVESKVDFTKMSVNISSTSNEDSTEAIVPPNTEILMRFLGGAQSNDKGESYLRETSINGKGLSSIPYEDSSLTTDGKGTPYLWPFDISLGGKFVFRIGVPAEQAIAGNGCNWSVWKVKSKVTGLEYNIE